MYAIRRKWLNPKSTLFLRIWRSSEIDRHLAGMLVAEIEDVIFNQRTCLHNDVRMKNATVVNEAG